MSDNKRRSISVRGTTYARLKAHCAANNTTCSAVVEAMIEVVLEAVRCADASPGVKTSTPPFLSKEEALAIVAKGRKTGLEPYGPEDQPDDTRGSGDR